MGDAKTNYYCTVRLNSLLLNVGSNVELGSRLVLDLLQRRSGLELDESQLAVLPVNVEDGEVGDDKADAAGSSEGQGALLDDLGLAVLDYVSIRISNFFLLQLFQFFSKRLQILP